MGFIEPVLPVGHQLKVIVALHHGFGNGRVERAIGTEDGNA